MKKRIIIIISVILIIFALICCITKKHLVIEIIPESSAPSNIRKTQLGTESIYINGKDSVTSQEQHEIITLCSTETVDAVCKTLYEYYNHDVILSSKAIYADNRGKLSVYYYYLGTCDGQNHAVYCEHNTVQNKSNKPRISGPTVVRVAYEQRSVILSAIFGNKN